jgi:hypothetical protein
MEKTTVDPKHASVLFALEVIVGFESTDSKTLLVVTDGEHDPFMMHRY